MHYVVAAQKPQAKLQKPLEVDAFLLSTLWNVNHPDYNEVLHQIAERSDNNNIIIISNPIAMIKLSIQSVLWLTKYKNNPLGIIAMEITVQMNQR